jgi:hypothetical protein
LTLQQCEERNVVYVATVHTDDTLVGLVAFFTRTRRAHGTGLERTTSSPKRLAFFDILDVVVISGVVRRGQVVERAKQELQEFNCAPDDVRSVPVVYK